MYYIAGWATRKGKDWEELARAVMGSSESDAGDGAGIFQDPVRLPPHCTDCVLKCEPGELWTPRKPLLGAILCPFWPEWVQLTHQGLPWPTLAFSGCAFSPVRLPADPAWEADDVGSAL